jgi:Fur family peroxide stress response transcriptional regulator
MAIGQLTEAVETLKEQGIRMTPQRHAILHYLLSNLLHPTADSIYKALVDTFPNISVATVYNNLRLFREAGLVKELTYGDASSRFDANMEEHYHVLCRNCGRITDLDHPTLVQVERAAAQTTGYRVDSHRLELYGVCPTCQQQKQS